jgi:hypothetical protein
MLTVQLPAKPYLSVPDAAVILGCTEGRVRQLIYASEINAIKLNAHAWAVERKSLNKYAEKDIVRGRPRISEKS